MYRAASIADSLNDLQSFVNDLIKTVEQTEEREHTCLSLNLFIVVIPVSQNDPNRTVQAFIDLVQRHEQSFYHFVHKVHSKGENLFNSLMRWIELFLTVTREGLGNPISLGFILPHTGRERRDILAEVDKVALYHYKLKLLYEAKLRRRFERVQANRSEADAEDQATQALVDGVVDEISVGGLIQVDDDLAAEDLYETDDSSSEFDSSSSEDHEEDSEESSNENLERTPRSLKSSVQTASRTATRSRPPDDRVPAPRKRSLSLKSFRSMTFSKSSEQLSPRKSVDDPPPVPPLPAYLTKPLPPSPSPRSSADHVTPPVANAKKPKLRKTVKAINPPELQHIPQLLPVFVEIVSHFS